MHYLHLKDKQKETLGYEHRSLTSQNNGPPMLQMGFKSRHFHPLPSKEVEGPRGRERTSSSKLPVPLRGPPRAHRAPGML